MRTNINIDLPTDFVALCHYSDEKPEAVLQSFANQMSFPKFFTTQDRNERFATYFFIKHIQSPDFAGDINESLEDHYFTMIHAAVQESFEKYPDDREKAMEAVREIMRLWAEAAIAERRRKQSDELS